MSFNYNPMAANQMSGMMPLLGNLTNGNNFMSPLAAASALQQITAAAANPNPLLSTLPASLNDSPLEFNVKKNLPAVGAGPMDLESNEAADHRSADNRNRRSTNSVKMQYKDVVLLDDTSVSSLDSPEKHQPNGAFNQNDLMFNGIMGVPQNLMMVPGMMNMMDPMLAMSQYPLLGQLGGISQQQQQQQQQQSTSDAIHPIKEVITCKSCTLFPPNPNVPPPTTRDRPPGCRTVFVGGLPENNTEDIIREIFERCGEITTLRLSKKNYCHIRFVFEASVDSAIYLSGYRIRIGASTDAANCGRLHVDYAQARDDQYEWECKQRQLQREQRHRERVERDRLRPTSPPPIVHYTDHEAAAIAEKLKQDDHFGKAVQVLIAWLERGDCSKKNSNAFYSMIQSSNSHVRRLQTEKSTFEEELQKAKEHYKKQMHSMTSQFNQIEKVFGAASHKKVWDHFTKAQRKNIDMWKKQSTEIRHVQLEDFIDEDEMDMSDDDCEPPSRNTNKRIKLDSHQSLQVENDSLKSELAAYKSDVDMVKSLLELDTDVKEKQLKVLQETIRNLQTQLLENKTKERDQLSRINELESKLKKASVKELLLKTKIVEACKQSTSSSSKISEIDENESIIDLDVEEVVTTGTKAVDSSSSGVVSPSIPTVSSSQPAPLKTDKTIDVTEAQIIGLVSTFLVVHPFGASLDYIFSYVQRIAPQLRPKELEEILSRYGSVFSEEVTGVGAKIERKWKFCGFDAKSVDTSQ